MQLVEQHLIRKSDARFAVIDQAAFAAKNLYNQATYQIRQYFFQTGRRLGSGGLFHHIKQMDCYQALLRKVSNSILLQIDQHWRAILAAQEDFKQHPEKYLSQPGIPGYKNKEKGRFMLIYDKQALGKRALKSTGKLIPSGLPIEIETKRTWEEIRQVRIVPRGAAYLIEVVYTAEEQPAPVDPALLAAIDLGVDRLVALVSNKAGFVPRLVNGRPLKDYNHYYNQQRAARQSRLAQGNENRRTSRQMERLTAKRTRRVNHYLHTASRKIVDLLLEDGWRGLIALTTNR